MDRPYHWDEHIDVHYSPDDGGYYAQCYRREANRGTSQLFDSFQSILKALSDGAIEWENERVEQRATDSERCPPLVEQFASRSGE